MAKQQAIKNTVSPRITKVSFGRRLCAYFLQHFQQIFSSFSELWRTPFSTLMTILVLGISLSVPSVFHVLYKNTESISSQWDKASEISLFLKKDISSQRVQVLINKLSLYDEIETVTLITSHQALEEFKNISGFSKALTYLGENPLPDVLVVVPTENSMNLAASKLLVAKLKREQNVDLVQVDLEWIEKLQTILSVAVDIVVAISALLLLSVLLVVINTIRLNILQQRPEIEVLKLVGATNRFIQRPYLYGGLWCGFLGGCLAWLFTYISIESMESGITNLMDLYKVDFYLTLLNVNEVGVLIAASSMLGLFASYISVKQYLVKIEPK